MVDCKDGLVDEVDIDTNENDRVSFAMNRENKELLVCAFSYEENRCFSVFFTYEFEEELKMVEKKDDWFVVGCGSVTEICESFSYENKRYFLLKGEGFGDGVSKVLFDEGGFLCQTLSLEVNDNETNVYFIPERSGVLGGNPKFYICRKKTNNISELNSYFLKNEYETVFSVFKYGMVDVEVFPFESKMYFVIKNKSGSKNWVGYIEKEEGVLKYQKVKRDIKSIIASNGALYLEFKNGYYKV